MSRLHRLLYLSRPAPAIDDSDLAAILAVARERNQGAGLTGFLAFRHDTFLQQIEGPASALSACLRRLMRDPRHEALQLISFEPIDARSFPDWGMGYAAVQVHHLPLLQRYAGGGELSLESISPGGARLLLEELSAEVMLASVNSASMRVFSESSTRSQPA